MKRATRLGSLRGARLPLALAGLVAALTGCSNRERTNPLDPGNPITGGSPAGFRALAGSGYVDLTWVVLEVPDLAGYEILRQGPSDPDFLPLTPVPLSPATSSFRDDGAGNDTTYAYRLQFRLTNGALAGTSDATARPGSANVWVADAAGDAVVRFTPDGRHRLFSLLGLNNPLAVAVEPGAGRVWGASGFEGFLALWAPDGALVGINSRPTAPLALAPIPGSDYVWVPDGRTGEVLLVAAGELLQTRFTGFAMPSDVAYDEVRLRLWIADREGRRLTAMDLSGNPIVNQPLDMAPWRMALHAPSGAVWLTSAEDGRAERRSVSGALLAARDGLARPFAMAVDAARDEVWIVLADGDEVVCFDAALAPLCRLSALQEPRGVAFDPTRDEVWVTTLGGRDGDGSLWNLQRDGTVIQTSRGGLIRPVAVAVDPTRNPPN